MTVTERELPTAAAPRSLEDVEAWLGWAALSIATGRLDADTGARLVSALDKLRLSLQHGRRVDERVKALERAISDARGR